MSPDERYHRIKEHLSEENPILVEVMEKFEALDAIGHETGLLEEDETYTSTISWWPLISVLGTFSTGKSSFINDYLKEQVQTSGNQAIDDKFTVICYGPNPAVTTLPGLALDADPRFPFYNINEEIKKVDPGEGNRTNLYLQLKTLRSESIKGKILIDSPGFDADSQRDAILKMTDHIIDISDLVLIFFDARHPEPGAMRDTLDLLVATAMEHRDANKVLYILNQIDTTAKEDNLEDVIGAWQRALSQKGLMSGNFFAIYNEEAAELTPGSATTERLKRKKDEDLSRIHERMDSVSVERAYRIIKTLEDIAETLRSKTPRLQGVFQSLSKRTLLADLFIIGGMSATIGVLSLQSPFLQGLFSTLYSTPVVSTISTLVLVSVVLLVHHKIRAIIAKAMARRWMKEDKAIGNALLRYTKGWKSLLRTLFPKWNKRRVDALSTLISESRRSIQKLNDIYVTPSGN